jgi:hypothetical protein
MMATQPHSDEQEPEDFYGVTYEELSREEGRALFEKRAQEWLGMSGEEFIRKLKAGEIEDPDRTDVISLAIMLPFMRGSDQAEENIMATQRQYDDHEPDDIDGVTSVELTREEGRAMFDRNAREWLGMSGDEFIEKWESGEIEDPDRSDVIMLAIMIPFGR